MKPIIVVLTHSEDDCATMVLDRFRKFEVETIRFNTEKFHDEIKTTMTLSEEGLMEGRYVFGNRVVNFNDISTVWNRRVHEPQVLENFGDSAITEWAKEEKKWAMYISFTLLQCPIVNPFESNERLKFNKMLQMKRAADLGFEVPYSCMTGERGSIVSSWNIVEEEMIFKKIRKGLFFFDDGGRGILHTNKIPKDKFNDEFIDRMKFTPVFLQRHIPKKYDIRSIVAGEEVISVAIHSQDLPEGKVDYRTPGVLGKIRSMKHEIIDLGQDVNRRLVEFTKSFDLTFGAIDLIITPDDRIVFLEDNPNGQWGWLEELTGAPIAEMFAKKLYAIATAHQKPS